MAMKSRMVVSGPSLSSRRATFYWPLRQLIARQRHVRQLEFGERFRLFRHAESSSVEVSISRMS
ncbi:hypothetical protein USDA257_c28140 [Sinorhizobium fredii USDA 257]|uniref:Uncharacterized protein n=1 Tax=Sinorhizobium fredii (strain USDA 257) TaxID=1185652 RepID=I3X679_SINF2|nr:hypothetical protein USDA257_c28140 [Sinorhizobium fredii USDA 257]